jgi:hypothetical protein
MTEDYTRARTLRAFEYLGESFRIVRRRINGKPWRKYLTMLHDNVPMVTTDYRTDPDEALLLWGKKIRRTFKSAEALRAAIAEQKARA